jgi:hypothetical protein
VGEAAVTQVCGCRRYECQQCGAVMTVLPASAQPYKHFSGAAIALALALWGLCQRSAAQVRAAVNDWVHTGAAVRGWRSLVRWAEQVGQGQLFAGLPMAAAGSARQQAERAAQALCGHAPTEVRHQGLEAQAFAGASHVS